MIVYRQRNRLPGLKDFFRLKTGLLKFLVLTICLFILGLIFILGIFLQKKGILSTYKPQLQKVAYLPKATYFQLTTHPKTLYIDISFKNLEKLKQKRQEALDLGILITKDDDFVPATITLNNEQIPVKLRLKGDWIDHLETDKWALRIHVKNNQALLGMSHFSLQPPQTRNNLNEWLFLKAAKNAGLIALRYDFVNVYVNGEPKGIYALEEHFSKELLENNQRREAPILKYNEDILWDQQAKFGTDMNRNFDYYYKTLIEPFQWGKTEGNPDLYQQFLRGEKLLQQYRDHQLPPDQVFDYDQWATYLALADLFGANHGVSWQNLRFYYNPLTDRLEPLPFDNMPGTFPREIMLNEAQPLTFPYQPLFEDEQFTRIYLAKLSQFLTPKYVNELLTQNQAQLKNYERILSREMPYTFDPTFLQANQTYMKDKLTPETPFIAFADGYSPFTEFEIFNTDRVPIEIVGIKTSTQEIFLETPTLIQTTLENTPLKSISIRFPLSQPLDDLQNTQIIYRFLHSSENRYQPVQPWPHIQIDSALADQNLSQIPGVAFDAVNQQYVINGAVTVPHLVSADKGKRILILPDSRIDFVNGGGIIATIPLIASGRQDHRISFTSSDDKGQGLLVKNTTEESQLSFISADRLRSLKTDFWETTGAVTFYKAPVTIANSNFANMQAEDALNIVNSPFTLADSQFSNSFSDALDVDFSDGKITNVACSQAGNDCFDFSGSTVDMKDVFVNQAGDKGVSVGEKSSVTIYGAHLKKTRIGFASKDSSYLRIDGIHLTDADYGIAIYQKKPEYGPAFAEIAYIDPANVGQLILAEKESSVWYNWQRRMGDTEQVYQMLYPENL